MHTTQDIRLTVKADLIIGTTVAMLGLALIAIVLRCYVKLRIVKSFAMEDYFALIAMVCPI